MTKHNLRICFITVTSFYALCVVLGIFFRIYDHTGEHLIYSTYKDMLPLVIAGPAAWLGFCLQKRASYMQQLRLLWSKLVDGVQTAGQYTHLPSPTQEDLQRALLQLSIAIDEVRGVFTNIGEDDEERGFYPFEPLKQILQEFLKLNYRPNQSEFASNPPRET